MTGFLKQLIERARANKIGRLFLDKKFLHYTWISIFISLLNIFLLWLFIDIFKIPTIISSTTIIGATFIIRFFLYRKFETFKPGP